MSNLPQVQEVTALELRWIGHRLNISVELAIDSTTSIADFAVIQEAAAAALHTNLPAVGRTNIRPHSVALTLQ